MGCKKEQGVDQQEVLFGKKEEPYGTLRNWKAKQFFKGEHTDLSS